MHSLKYTTCTFCLYIITHTLRGMESLVYTGPGTLHMHVCVAAGKSLLTGWREGGRVRAVCFFFFLVAVCVCVCVCVCVSVSV